MMKVLMVLFIISSLTGQSQILIPNTTALTENFDGMGTGLVTPANWRMHQSATPTWAAGTNALNFQFSSGAPATGGKYNWGTTPATDRSLGVLTSGSYASPNSIISFYQNTNASNLTQLTVSYDAERYRVNTAAASIQFFYSLNGSTWVAVTAGDIAPASFPTAASAYTFGAPLVVSVGSFNITGLNIATNGTIYLRWNLNTTGANSQGIGIDNVSVTAAFTVPCVPPTTTVTPVTQTVCANTSASMVVGSSAVTPTYQWQMSANGTTGWANVANGTPTGITYSGGTTATLSATGTSSAQYYYQCLVTESGSCTATTSTVSLTIISGPSITTQPISVTTTSTGTASYTVTASGTGLSYQWQQNSGSGFSNLSNGGTNPTYAGVTNSVLTISNPPLSMSGYSYQCVVSNSCGTVTTNGTATLTVNIPSSVVCPQITGVLVNACDGSCSEGDNEIVFFNSGTYNIPVSPANIILKYDNVNPPTVTYSDAFTTNAAQIATLNTLAGCGTLFIDAMVAGTIPAGSSFMMVKSTSCFNFDFSSYCSAGPIYVLFSTDASWTSGGNFVNSGAAGVLRYFRSDFSAVAPGCVINYNYEPNLLTGGDGAAITFPSGGGAANSYINNGCSPPPIILPISLLDFYGTRNKSVNELVWKVAEEDKILGYTIEKSEDAINFAELAVVALNQNKPGGGVKTYNLSDETPFEGITYYRLSSKEESGSKTNYKIIAVDESQKDWAYNQYQQDADLIVEFKNTVPKNSTVDLFDLSGKLLVNKAIDQSRVKINTNELATGIYFVRITTPYKTQNFKIVIQK